MKFAPYFSVVIPTRNRYKLLGECLARLSPEIQSVDPEFFEVIVTDDSTEEFGRREAIEAYPWVDFIQGPGIGPAANRNNGADIANGTWLIFVDDDCLPASGFLESYRSAAESCQVSPMTLLIGPTLRTAPPRSLLWEGPSNPSGEIFISANFGIRKSDFLMAGRFDERFPSAAFEDTEFFSRFSALGGKCHFVKSAEVHHPLRRIPSSYRLAKRWEGKVICVFDQGASPWIIAWRFPWHVTRVIQSRFRGQAFSGENLKAGMLFVGEWLLVLLYCPAWIWKWSKVERAAFWVEKIQKDGPSPKYGL